MRKLLLFFIALLTGVSGAWADADAPKNFVSSIQTGVNYLWCLDDGSHPRFIHADGTKTASYGNLTSAAIFQFEDAGDGYYYIKEMGSGNYMYTEYANSITQPANTTGNPWVYYSNNVLAAGTKEDADKFKWKVSTGSFSNGFFISSKVNENAVLAATGQGNTGVYFYQYTTSNKYPFANSKFLKVATAMEQISTSKCYNIYNNRAVWAVSSGATDVNSTNELSLAVSGSDNKQQFAFINYAGKNFLYSISEKKFAYVNGDKLSLTPYPGSNLTSVVTLTTSTALAQYISSAPSIITIGGGTNYYGVSTGKTPDVFKWADQTDNGNASAIIEAADFDLSDALETMEGNFPFTPSTIESPIYYAISISSDNQSWFETSGSNVACGNNRSLPTGDASNYAWLLIGNATDGYKLYNKGSGNYLGGREGAGDYLTLVAEASAESFYPVYNNDSSCKFYDKTNNLWIDRASSKTYAHTSGQQLTFQRLYKVKFALDTEEAGLQVGSATVSDFNTEYVITTSASLSTTNAYYKITGFDGYSTLADALTNDNDGTINLTTQQMVDVTYKMMFNGSEIERTVIREDVGATASTPSEWTTPAFSSFTCPSTEITAETSEIEVTLNWNGPFDFSTDFASAKWYYMAFNGGYLIYDETAPYGFSTREDAIAAGEDAIWAFIGDPYNGVRVINKTAGNGKYLNLSSTVQMAEATYPRYSLCGITENSTSETIGFSLDNDDYYYLCYYVPEEGDPYLWYGTGKAWAATSKGRITVEPYIVTYNLKFGGSTIATKTVDKVTGDSEELFPSEWARDFCTYSYEPAEIGNSTTSVDVTMTWNGPFDISADYENAVWYYMAVNGKWSKQVAFEAPNIYDDISEVKGLDVGEWAFYGNPYDGFLLSPKAKYSTYQIYLSSAAETPAFTLATESTEKWVAKKISGSTFTLNCGDKYLVDNTTTMGFKTTALEGSEGTFSVRSYYCQKGLDDFADYVGESTDKYFGVKPTSVTSVNSMIENMPKMTEAQYTENFTDLYNSLKSYIIFNWPETGYYRIKNNNYGDYIGYGKPEGLTGGQPKKTAGLVAIPSSNKATDYSTVIRLTKVSASLNTGVYTIATQGLNVQGTPSANAVYTASGSDDPVQFKFVVDGTPGIVYIKDSNASGSGDATEGCFHEENWSESHTLNGIVPYIHGAAPSKWVAEDVDEISIALNGPVGGYRYATLCVPFDVTLDAEAAYTLSLNANKDALTLSSASNEIAAGTPVLLRDESSSLTATIGTGYAAAPLTSTSLTGVYVDTQVSGTNYFLGVDSSDEIGFYHWGTGTKTLDANRAYFEASKLSNAVKGLSLIWDEETGINSIENGKLKIENEAVYDLSGRRVAKPTKGLYIKNGKKTVIK